MSKNTWKQSSQKVGVKKEDKSEKIKYSVKVIPNVKTPSFGIYFIKIDIFLLQD